MNEALHFIRKAIIDRLTNQITVDSATVPVYNRVPSDATAPYIKVFLSVMMRLIAIKIHSHSIVLQELRLSLRLMRIVVVN